MNIDNYLRDEIVVKIKDNNITKTVFNPVEHMIIYQLKTGVYNLFLNSEEFKRWISTKYQKELLNTMSQFLMDFGGPKDQSEKSNDCCIIV